MSDEQTVALLGLVESYNVIKHQMIGDVLWVELNTTLNDHEYHVELNINEDGCYCGGWATSRIGFAMNARELNGEMFGLCDHRD